MIEFSNESIFLFVIDTTSYAGNFERKLAAYCTGCISDCGTGEREARTYWSSTDRLSTYDSMLDYGNELIHYAQDKHGTRRMCTIFPNPDFFNNGIGGHFKHGQENAAWNHFRKEQRKSGGRNKSCPHIKYPAYLSTAILLKRSPTHEEVELIRRRAEEYCKENSIVYTGYRIFEYKMEIIER